MTWAAIRGVLCVPPFWLLIMGSAGCRALPWRTPIDERVVAAREQGRLALDSLHHGRLKEAQARFLRALDRCPDDPQLRHDYAKVLWESGQTVEAITAMDTAIRGSGGEPVWITELGEMFLAENELQSALEAAERALGKDPRLGCAWRLRGDVMLKSGQLETAVANYHRALSSEACPITTLPQLAETYRRQGRPRRALATLQRLAEIAPQEQRPSDLTFQQGLALQALGRHEDAMESFAQARQEQGDDPELLLRLARSQAAAGFTTSAVETARSALQIQPGNLRIQALLTELEPSPTHQLTGAELPVDHVGGALPNLATGINGPLP